jgi:hypothetical protein
MVLLNMRWRPIVPWKIPMTKAPTKEGLKILRFFISGKYFHYVHLVYVLLWRLYGC